MTSTFGMVRDAGLDAWSLPDRATKLGFPTGIAGLDFEGDRTTFKIGAAGAKMTISCSEGNGA